MIIRSERPFRPSSRGSLPVPAHPGRRRNGSRDYRLDDGPGFCEASSAHMTWHRGNPASNGPGSRGAGEITTMDDAQGKNPAKDVRAERLKQALRENLKRRKAQARQRSAGEIAPSQPDEAAFAKDAGERDE